MTHTIVYLKGTPEALIADISQVFEGYNGEIDFSKLENLEQYAGHWIGQIPIKNEDGEEIGLTLEHHVNLLLPIEFDSSVFTTKKETPPQKVYHTFQTDSVIHQQLSLEEV